MPCGPIASAAPLVIRVTTDDLSVRVSVRLQLRLPHYYTVLYTVLYSKKLNYYFDVNNERR